MNTIVRETRSGGRLKLRDTPTTSAVCATCGNSDPIALQVFGTTDHPTEARKIAMDTTTCADCIAEGLAIVWGRAHVIDGGNVDDLSADHVEVPPIPGETDAQRLGRQVEAAASMMRNLDQ